MKLLFTLIIFCLTAPLWAETEGLLHAEWERHGTYREDKGGLLTIDAILKDTSEAWIPVAAEGFNLGFKSAPYWLRLPLPSCAGMSGTEKVLEVAYPILDRLDLWFLGTKGLSPVHTTGDSLPYHERPIEHLTFGFPYTCGVYQEIILRVDSTSSLQLPINIWERRAYEQHLLELERPQLLYFGAVLIMALYNFFIYLIVRRPPYLHYVLFVLSFATFQAGISGMGFRYLWPDLPGINTHVIDKAVNCIAIFAFAFTMSFLNARELTPRLYRLGTRLNAGLILYTFIAFLVPYGVAIKISIAFITTAISIVLLITAHSIAKHQREGYYYGLAWATFLVGTITIALNKLGMIPRTTLTEYFQQISSVLEMLLLSFALADQMNVLRFNLTKSNQQLEKTLQSIEEIVKQKIQSIRSIMDTLQVGIITIATQDFLIEAEYSQHTEAWLGEQNLGGKRFQEVFLNRFMLGEDGRALILSALQAIMDEPSDNFQFNGFHLPQEGCLVTASGLKEVMIDWTPILNQEGRVIRILIAFHDVTELHSLRLEQAAKSRILIRLNQLLCADDMALRIFLLRGRRTLDAMRVQFEGENRSGAIVHQLFIAFHTLKGESRSLGLTELSDQFHGMEDRLDQVRKKICSWHPGDFLRDIAVVENIISEYVSLYESHIGSLTEEHVVGVKQDKLEKWEEALQRIKPRTPDEHEAHRVLLKDVFHILHMDLVTYAEKLQKQARRIARELGKPDPQVLLAGQGIFLSQIMIEQLDQIFIHVLQNALVHGIESADERKAAAKGAAGLIHINLARQGNSIVVKVRDDGRGVDLASIQKRALQLGVIRSLENLSEARLEACLLHAGFTSRDQVTNHAGRGVGMGAIRQYVEDLLGHLHLEFAPELDGHRSFTLVMTFPAYLFPILEQDSPLVA